MAQKTNYHAARKGTKDGEIKWGHIHNDNVLSALMLRSGHDYRHYITMDADSTRQGHTLVRCPGVFHLRAGDDIPYNKESIVIEALSGDITLKAMNGRIRLEAENIYAFAKGSGNSDGIIEVESNEAVNIRTKKVLVDVSSFCKLISAGTLQLVSDGLMDIYGGLVDCATGSSKKKPSKYYSNQGKMQGSSTNFVK